MSQDLTSAANELPQRDAEVGGGSVAAQIGVFGGCLVGDAVLPFSGGFFGQSADSEPGGDGIDTDLSNWR